MKKRVIETMGRWAPALFFSPDDPAGGEGDDRADQTEVQSPEHGTSQPDGPPSGYIHQDEVNAIVAREVAKAKRQAKKSTQQGKPAATQADATQSPEVFDDLNSKISALADVVTTLSTKLQETELASQFKLETQGLDIPDTEIQVLQTLKRHEPALYEAKLKEIKRTQTPPEARGAEPYKGPGQGGAPAPRTPTADDPLSWTKDDIADMKAKGTFKDALTKARNKMPGGRGGLFPTKY